MRIVRLLIALLVFVGAGAVVALAVQRVTGGGTGGGYMVRAVFDNSSFVIPGEQVKVAGVTIGTIHAVQLTQQNKAAVVLQITNSKFEPFRTDAHCEIGIASLLGEQFVQCTPTQSRASGDPPPPALATIKSGPGKGEHLLPVQNTTAPIGLDLLNDITRLPEQERLRLIISGLGAGLAGNGQELNAALLRADPALQQTDKVIQVLASQDRTLARLTDESSRVLAPLAAQRRHIAGFVQHAGTVATASAQEGQAIQQNLRDLPPFLHQLRPAAARLSNLAGQLTPALESLRAQAPAINTAVTNLGPLADTSIPAFKTLGNVAERGETVFPQAHAVSEQLLSLGKPLMPLATDLASVAQSFDNAGGIEDVMRFIYYYTGAVNGEDALGHYIRALVEISSCVVRSSLPALAAERRSAPPRSAALPRRARTTAAPATLTPHWTLHLAADRSSGHANLAESRPGDRLSDGPEQPDHVHPHNELADGGGFGDEHLDDSGRRDDVDIHDGSFDVYRAGLVDVNELERHRADVDAAARRRYGLTSARFGIAREHQEASGLPALTMNGRRSQSPFANRILIGAVTVLVLVIAVFLAYTASSQLPFVPTYDVNAEVPDAAGLIPTNEVLIGGTRVGYIGSITAAKDATGSPIAVLHLKLNTSIKALPADSTDLVRPVSPLGSKYLQITRGHSSQTLAAGSTIPLSHTTLPVEIDDFFDMFTPKTRIAIQTGFINFGDGLAGRGPALNQAVSQLEPLVDNLLPVMTNLLDRQTQLPRLFPSLEQAAHEVVNVAGPEAQLFAGARSDLHAALADHAGAAGDDHRRPAGAHDGDARASRAGSIHRRHHQPDPQPAARVRQARPGLRAARAGRGGRVPGAAPGAPAQRSPARDDRCDRRFAQNPQTIPGLGLLTETAKLVEPTVAFIEPAQTQCNYLALLFRNLENALSESDQVGTMLGVNAIAPPQLPNSEAGPASAPADGPPARIQGLTQAPALVDDSFLHSDPYPFTAAPGSLASARPATSATSRAGR